MNWYKTAKKAQEDPALAKIPKGNKNGDCFQAAGRYMMDNGRDDKSITLVHGEVTGQGRIQGIKFGHGWIEKGNDCIDVSLGRNIVMPKEIYYMLGQIDESKVYRYNYDQFQEKILSSGNWGPWDLITKF